MACDQLKIGSCIFADTIDVGHDFYRERHLPVARDEIKTPRPHAEPFGDEITPRDHHADDHLEEPVLCHLPLGWV